MGNMGGAAPFLGPSTEGLNFYFMRRTFMRNSRDIENKALETLSIGAPVGEPGMGFVYRDLGETDERGLRKRSIAY